MAAHTTGPNGLIPIHIAVHDPAPMEEPGPQANDYVRDLFAASAKYAGISWTRYGAEPRWLGMDTSTCAAAINPSHFSSRGADEFDRFLSGAASRGEPALIIATMGTADEDDDRVRSVFGRPGGRVDFRNFTGAIVGERLLAGAEVSLVPGLDAADRDLGLRLLNRPADAPWWAMSVQASALVGQRGTTVREPEGELVPILVDSLGEPVVARWTSGDGQQIWYVIPDAVDWNQVVDWLVQRALPEHVPAALRRVRSCHHVDPALETPAETQARSALEELERRYLEDKARLEDELERARQEAEPVRSGLLYGSGSELEDAVAVVLRAAGFAVTDLDEELGDTLSADLLAVLNGSTCLVEVKAAAGAAGEKLISQLQRHLEKWPQLRPGQPVTCAALIVNHQHRLEPAERSAEVYQRRVVDALPFPVIASGDLFRWWRTQDWAALQAAVLGQAHVAGEREEPPAEGRETPAVGRRRWRPWSKGGPA
ncbi:hypothetical protein [Streptomyces griseomycini]|uniref:Uncharacterized protein n=1 Tax=Streptomyces griseomycini TaxID=66895 RepID=A0A7W7PYI0_9ACTN|nr:hypothetical protein [Streptomyces griseomycini]MBB4903558.1 hypothetical protein [Streptomyces griseomycini]GGR58439.1 hypothetical protein GCM10015536_73770 [Streptomyces griseomycini]